MKCLLSWRFRKNLKKNAEKNRFDDSLVNVIYDEEIRGVRAGKDEVKMLRMLRNQLKKAKEIECFR